jgi:hypothetical protein
MSLFETAAETPVLRFLSKGAFRQAAANELGNFSRRSTPRLSGVRELSSGTEVTMLNLQAPLRDDYNKVRVVNTSPLSIAVEVGGKLVSLIQKQASDYISVPEGGSTITIIADARVFRRGWYQPKNNPPTTIWLSSIVEDSAYIFDLHTTTDVVVRSINEEATLRFGNLYARDPVAKRVTTSVNTQLPGFYSYGDISNYFIFESAERSSFPIIFEAATTTMQIAIGEVQNIVKSTRYTVMLIESKSGDAEVLIVTDGLY